MIFGPARSTTVSSVSTFALPLRPLLADEESDEALSAAALEGCSEAWGVLVRRHERRVLVALLARGVRIDRARDITQETWTKLLDQQRAGRLAHLSLPGLAIRQALFLAKDEAKRPGSVRPHLALDDAASELLSREDHVHQQVSTRAELASAGRALAACTPSARRIFLMIYGEEGLSPGEVADRLGLSLQRVRQTVCEVRKKLRAALEEGS